MKTACSIVLIIFWSQFFYSCSKTTDIEHEEQVLLQTDRDFAKTSVEKGAAEAFRQYITSDAIQFATGFDPIHGSQNIYEQMKAGMDSTVTLDWEPKAAEVAQSGEMGYTWGLYTVCQQDVIGGTRKMVGEGKYVNIWKKDPDGSWNVVIDIGNSSNIQE